MSPVRTAKLCETWFLQGFFLRRCTLYKRRTSPLFIGILVELATTWNRLSEKLLNVH
nr:MAG TPA: hypothetical protein [Caudoviricetes sp.]